MSDRVIAAEGLSKRYTISHRPGNGDGLRHKLHDFAVAPLRWFRAGAANGDEPSIPLEEHFWALRNVSFEIQRGEVVAIIGRNGAGKSTLLKVLSRITEPTEGRVTIRGRVASLLEVGTGFHPELTGRENIYLNGSILGMSRQEVRRKFDEIVDFAEVEQFLDTPVKRYSSGMYLRLAFAVAAHLESEVLVVDEVLAVGDQAFQQKCLGKMEETSHQGRTILFVSHNLAAVNQLCQRVIWLSKGVVRGEGPTLELVSRYLTSGEKADAERTWSPPNHTAGNGRVQLVAARVSQEGRSTGVVDINRAAVVEMDVLVTAESRNLVTSLHVLDVQGTTLFRSCDWRPNRLLPGRHRSAVEIPAHTLAEGRMNLLLEALFFDPFAMCYHEPNALAFDAIDSNHPDAVRGPYLGPWPGGVRLKLAWKDWQSLPN
jgi:lipopolysaccharide transport system ATP-binding protein